MYLYIISIHLYNIADNFKKNRIFDQVQKDQKKQLSPLDIPFAVQLRHHPGVLISCTITAVQKSTQKFKI